MPTGHADRLMPALRRAVLVRETADRTDGQLLTAFVHDRDADAFAVLVRRHGPMVLGVCRRVVGDVHAADDTFQAVFLVLARRAAAVRPREQVGNWLYGVSYRTAIKARMVLARHRSREKQVVTMPEPPASPTADPWADLHPVIDDELARLPDKLRLPVVLCDLEGRPQRAVAKHLGVAPATLAARLGAARRLLAGRLTRRGVTLSGGALAGVLGQQASAAAVAPGLAETTVMAAGAVAAGTGVTGLVSAHAVQLCEGVMRMMMLSKLKAAGVSALAVLTLTGGLGFGLLPARAGDGPGTPPAAARQPDARPAPRPTPPARPIDEKIFDRLNARGLDPASPVDDATFLRRLCLDLIGTLPTPLETGYFVGDDDTNKRRKLVDWLLAEDAVREFLAKKLGIPGEQIRVVWAADAGTGQVLRLAVVRPETGYDVRSTAVATVLAFSPDGKALAGEPVADAHLELSQAASVHVHGKARLFMSAVGANSNAGMAGTIIVNERNAETTAVPAPVNLNFLSTDLAFPVEAGRLATARWRTVQLTAPHPTLGQPPVVVADPATGQESLRFWVADPRRFAFEAQQDLIVVMGDTDEAFLGRAVEQARGTPPTAVEKKYFLEDKDPKKREKVLDLLLKEPAVAKKLGDDWKKKMLEPVATTAALRWLGDDWKKKTLEPAATATLRWGFAPHAVPAHPPAGSPGLKIEFAPAAPQPDRMETLVGELLAAKKTDEQVLEAVTLAAVGRLPTAEERRATLAVIATVQDRKAAWVGLAKALAGTAEAKKSAPPATTPTVPPSTR